VKSELLATSPMLILPLVALILFIVVFTSMLIVTFKKRAPAYDPLARMPLDDDDDVAVLAAQKGASR
jgi:predicted permease